MNFIIGVSLINNEFVFFKGGQYILDLVDYFGGTFVIFLFAILEVIVVNWFYGEYRAK